MEQLDLFAERLPARPYCTDDLTFGLIIRPKASAARCRYIQPNTPFAVSWLVFDLDHPYAAVRWEDDVIPTPSIIVTNCLNGHARLLYAIETPVFNAAGHPQPLRLAAAIQEALRQKLGGDIELWSGKDEHRRMPWPTTMQLSNDYFANLKKHAVPLDERALAALAHSAMALDIYTWLAQRLHRIPPNRPQFVSWNALKVQFGQGYDRNPLVRPLKAASASAQTRYPSLAKTCLFFGFLGGEKFGGKGCLVAAAVAVLGGASFPLDDGAGLALGGDDVGFHMRSALADSVVLLLWVAKSWRVIHRLAGRDRI